MINGPKHQPTLKYTLITVFICNSFLLNPTYTFSQNIWIGAADNSWNNAANWSSNTVPTADTDVIIQPSQYNPLISSDSNCKNLILEENSLIRINAGTSLSIHEDMDGKPGSRIERPGSGTAILSLVGKPGRLSWYGSLSPGIHLESPAENGKIILDSDITLENTTNNLTVNGTIDFNSHIVTGEGRFTGAATTHYLISHPNGLHFTENNTVSGHLQVTITQSHFTNATFIYNGQAPQITGKGMFGTGSTGKKFIIDNPTTVTMGETTGASLNGFLEIRQGIFITSDEAFLHGGASVHMREGAGWDIRESHTSLPRLQVGILDTLSFIKLSGAGEQALRGADDPYKYRIITFEGSGNKALVGTNTSIDHFKIEGNCIVDMANRRFGLEGADFTMSAGVLKVTGTSHPVPPMNGKYMVSGGTVELSGTSANNNMTLRNKQYHNVSIFANEANYTTENVLLTGATSFSGTLKVHAPAVLRTGANAFIDGTGTFELMGGAGYIYGHAAGINNNKTGNIRINSFSLPTTAYYGFSGTSAGMVTGNALPGEMAGLIFNRTNGVTLSKTLKVNEFIKFNGGAETSLNTEEHEIDLAENASVIHENENGYINGKVTKTITQHSALSTLPDIGLTLSITPDNFRPFKITRVTGSPITTSNNASSIARYFEVEAGNNIQGNLKMSYHSRELGELIEENLGLFSSEDDRSSWTIVASDLNEIEKSLYIEDVSLNQMWTAADIANPLPVKLLTFTGEIENGVAMLFWSTASEFENAGFEIQKSYEGIHFDAIGFVEGAGNSQTMRSYSYTDDSFFQHAYYRLVQIDEDGSIEYSSTIFLQDVSIAQFVIYPSPFADSSIITIQANAAMQSKANLKLINLEGKVLLCAEGTLGELEAAINDLNPTLPTGLYVVHFSSSNEYHHRLKIVKR